MTETKSEFEFQEPVSRIWQAITVYEVLIHWLADEVRGRPKLGGEFSWTWKLGLEGNFTTHGIYETIVPEKKLVLAWKDHPIGDLKLHLEFESTGPNSSKLTVANRVEKLSNSQDDLLEVLREAWEEQVTILKKFLGENSDFSLPKFQKKSG